MGASGVPPRELGLPSDAAVWVFSDSGFHRLFETTPSVIPLTGFPIVANLNLKRFVPCLGRQWPFGEDGLMVCMHIGTMKQIRKRLYIDARGGSLPAPK
jgi:hypothetical protein